MSKKGKKHKRNQKPASSEIIRQCVIYVQSMAAYQAGFKVDLTGNFDHAGSGKGQPGRDHLRTADHALARLVARLAPPLLRAGHHSMRLSCSRKQVCFPSSGRRKAARPEAAR
jgi:hypothetical protein